MFKKMIKAASLCSILLFTTTVSAGETLSDIAKSGELKVCFDAGYMPFEMKAKSGKFIGFDVDLGKYMAKSMGVKYVPVNTAWDGIIPALLTGKCHMITSGMTVTAQRNMRVNFADPYIVIGQAILLNPKLKGKIKSYKDLNKPEFRIVSKLGTTGEKAAKSYIKKAKYSAFETEADAAMEVANGKADAFIYDLPYISLYAAQNPERAVAISEAFTYEPLGWAVRQGDPDMLNFLNNFIRQIQKDGTYERIYNKWFNSSSWLKQLK